MEKIRLGKTDMMVSRVGLGGVPIQKVSEDEAVSIVRSCLDFGITFFDTAIEYTNSEERIGEAIRGQREKAILATKTNYGTNKEVERNLEKSLKQLGVNYIDLYQFHGISDFETYSKVIDPSGPINVINEAKRTGLVKHVGMTSHSMDIAKEAVKSGIFETIMFPFNLVSCEPADDLLPLARRYGVGFIAMKPLAGGRLKNIDLAFKYLLQFPDVVPIPGVQSVDEIDEIVQVVQKPRLMTEEEQSDMQRLRDELGNRFCRRCGYCEPCPEGVPVLYVMDIVPFMINMPSQLVFTEEVANSIEKVTSCTRCGECEKKCPYGLPIMELLDEHSNLYQTEKKKY